MITIYSSWYQARTERTSLQLAEIARSTDTSFTLFIDGMIKSMRLVGLNIVNNKLSAQETSSALSELLAIYPIDNAVFADPSGTIVAATDSHLVGQSLAKHPAFSAIIAGNESKGIEPVERVVSPVGFHIAKAIRDSSGTIQGIVSCYVDITRLGSALPIRTTAGATNIVDSNGTLVFQSEFQKLVLTDPFWDKYGFVKTALSGKNAVSTDFVFPATGRVRIIAEVPISEFGWAAGSSVDAAQVLDPIRRDIINSALVATAILIIALIVSILIVRRVISSLSYLAERARAVGEGHFDEPVLIATGDEIEDVAHSLDEARLNLKQAVENLSESNKRIQLLLQSTDEGIYGVDTKEHCTFINKAASEMLGYKPEEILGENVHELIHNKHSDGSPYPEAECPIYRAYQTGQGVRIDTEVFWRNDGTLFPVEYSSYPIIEEGVIEGAVVTFTDITERKQAQELSDALNSINAAITSTLDFNEIMQIVVIEASKAIGCETAGITLYEDGNWVARYIYGFPEEKLGSRYTNEEVPHAVLAARTRKPVIVNDAFNDSRVNREVQKSLGIRSVMVIPLMARKEGIGALFFNYRTSIHTFTDAQVDFANKLGPSISLSLENARLYRAEQNIANTLQEALLSIPQRVGGIEFGHLYRSATEAAIVGGDFYDLFELEQGRVGTVIGDVSGKGIGAASLTALVRNTLRAYALEGHSPALVMAKTNDAVAGASSPKSPFITVFFGILDVETGHLTYCSAGHPPALIKRRTGKAELLVTNSPFIGAFVGLSYIDDEITLDKGDSLILYTDGVIEARCDGEFFGEERLVRFIEELGPVSARDLPQAVFNEIMGCTHGKLSDDLAILSVGLEASKR